MYGNSGKLGRGGGGGGRGGGSGGKRNIHSTFHPPSLHRPSSAGGPGGRLSMGGGGGGPRNRSVSTSAAGSSASTSSSAATTEETFSLVTGSPLNFAMIIRLAPDLVEQIKRVEAQGGTARIKFDANNNNPAGNVINVGGKDFRFTWSPETGELCEIYEERQSGEDGNGLLVESGCAWRKLNVQRILDESTKNHVKMRSEEAERKLKSRKAIVLDHGNPSTKSQIRAMAAVESNPWRTFKTKKEQPSLKKRKAETPSGGPLKSVYKSDLTTAPPSKGRPQTSPLSSPHEQSGAAASPFGSGNLAKGHTNVQEIISTQAMNKSISSEKDIAGRVVSNAVQEKSGGKGTIGAQPSDLRAMLISLLSESPSKGMSLKTLEKAVGDAIPNSVRQIEPILKKIATFQAPGRYFLKPGVDIESFKKPLSETQSSPEDNTRPSPNHEKNDQQAAVEPSFPKGADIRESEEQELLNSKSEKAPNSLEKIDGPCQVTDLFGEKKVSDNSEGPVGSSSDSGSDSDSESDSSDSGSDSGSHSRSRSRSPVGSGSGSSSDSESDASTNSKEASDEDVDIMTSDDDKEAKLKLRAPGLGSPKSPVVWRTKDDEPGQIGIDEKEDGHVSDLVEIEKDLPADEHVREVASTSNLVAGKEGGKLLDEIDPLSHYRHEHQESQDYSQKIHSETDMLSKDGFNHEQSESSEKVSKDRYKRALDKKHFDGKLDRIKRLKAGNLNQQQISGSRSASFVESHQNPSPDRHFQDPLRGSNGQMANKIVRDGNTAFGLHKGYNQTISGKSKSDSQQAIGSADPGAQAKNAASVERSGKHSENLGPSVKHPERSLRIAEGFPMQKDKFTRDTQDDYNFTNHKGSTKFSKEDFGEKHTTSVDTHQRKHETPKNFKEFGSVSNPQMVNSPKVDGANIVSRSVGNGRANVLQRELSDLELGELREPLSEEIPGFSRQSERKGSSKQAENKLLSSENWSSDSGKGKPPGKVITDSGKSSPLNSNIPVFGTQEGGPKKVIPENRSEDLSKPYQRIAQSQHQQHGPREDHTRTGTQGNRGVELSGRNRLGDAARSQDIAPELHGNFQNKGPASGPQENGSKRGAIPPSRKEGRKQKSNAVADLNDKQKDASLTGSSDGSQKRRESSSDENSCPYSKYEKEEPELKGPIKDFSQYQKYVDEFQEKHDSYISLNNILESYREEFLKYRKEFEASVEKDKARYNAVCRQITEAYHRHAERHKRLKKIFLLLHKELTNLKEKISDFATPYLKDQ